jgi:hypothetical protein
MKEDYMEQIKQIAEIDDVEDRHIEADTLLCKILENEGYKEIAEIFRNMHKYYA